MNSVTFSAIKRIVSFENTATGEETPIPEFMDQMDFILRESNDPDAKEIGVIAQIDPKLEERSLLTGNEARDYKKLLFEEAETSPESYDNWENLNVLEQNNIKLKHKRIIIRFKKFINELKASKSKGDVKIIYRAAIPQVEDGFPRNFEADDVEYIAKVVDLKA